ncbi:8107_t:CDS:2 [Diversispora eburnea]|uniref:8107_t:CDS:1 n=1 Tax=Diversispora eburnea TaxID=1213867 RepID=A0A9N8WH14_9GLOM|nr:8107_t:CDS:2 [Diversispora eburnea]
MEILINNSVIELVRGYPKLQNLEISWDGNITNRSIYKIAKSYHDLRYLEISRGSYSDLRKLNLSDCDKVTDIDTVVEAVTQSCYFYKLITDITIKDITHNLSNLKYLDLKYCVNISKEALDMLNLNLDVGEYYTIPSAL